MKPGLSLFRYDFTVELHIYLLNSVRSSPQHAFENLEDSAKDGIVDELLNQGPSVFSEVAKSQWGSYCIQHSTF